MSCLQGQQPTRGTANRSPSVLPSSDVSPPKLLLSSPPRFLPGKGILRLNMLNFHANTVLLQGLVLAGQSHVTRKSLVSVSQAQRKLQYVRLSPKTLTRHAHKDFHFPDFPGYDLNIPLWFFFFIILFESI